MERRRCPPFLALEQHWRERPGQQQGGGYSQAPRAHEGAAAVAVGPVADLVVVLGEHDELVAPQPDRWPPLDAVTVRLQFAVVDPRLAERLGQQLERTEVRVVAARLRVQHGE